MNGIRRMNAPVLVDSVIILFISLGNCANTRTLKISYPHDQPGKATLQPSEYHSEIATILTGNTLSDVMVNSGLQDAIDAGQRPSTSS